MGLFKLGWMAKDETRAVNAVNRIPQSKQAALLDAANNGRPAVQIAAIKRIEDPAELERLSREAYFDQVKLAAADRLTHDKALQQRRIADIILGCHGAGFTHWEKEVVARITDQQLLLEVALSADARFAHAAASLLTDQALLEEIARKGPSARMRLQAAQRVDSAEARQAHLASIARDTHIDSYTRLDAALQLADEPAKLDVLTDILFRSRSTYECGQILRHLANLAPDRIVLAANTHPVEQVCWVAQELTEDPAAIEEIARAAEHWSTRIRAVRRVENQAVLAEIAMREESEHVFGEACGKLTSQDALEQLARQCKNARGRIIAAGYLKNPALEKPGHKTGHPRRGGRQRRRR